VRRRGFTLIETVLALIVGALVLAASLGVLTTVQRSDVALTDHAREMNDLARTQSAARRAMDTLLAAPSGAVRGALGLGADSEVLAGILDTALPEPIPGLPARLEMSTGENPRLEAVLSRPLLDTPAAGTRSPGDDGRIAVAAGSLPGHRGAFELRPEPGAEGPTLWWVPLPPPEPPEWVMFDPATLPPPHRLCRNVTLLRWTAFIDSARVSDVRVIESIQYPAYIELEIATAGGGYGNWTFELGWTVGPELDAPPEAEEPEAQETLDVPALPGGEFLPPLGEEEGE
jgi:prepilin-type N-terminal cleavage/methylation domain-containing protein